MENMYDNNSRVGEEAYPSASLGYRYDQLGEGLQRVDYHAGQVADQPVSAPAELTAAEALAVHPPELAESEVAAFVDMLPHEVAKTYRCNLDYASRELAAGKPLVGVRKKYDGTVTTTEVPAADFNRFITNLDEEQQRDIAYGAEKIAAFDRYREAASKAFDSPGEQLRGTNTRVARMQVGGERLVVRDGRQGFLTHDELRTYRLSEAVDPAVAEVPQLRAADFNERQMIVSEVPGHRMDEVPRDERLAISDSMLTKAINGFIAIDQAGLRTDPRYQNFLIDAQKGIGFVDLSAKSGLYNAPLSGQVFSLVDILTVPAADGSHIEYGQPGYDEQQRELAQGYAVLGNRFLDIIEQTHPELIAEAAALQAESDAGRYEDSWGSLVFLNAKHEITDGPNAAFIQRLERLGLAGRGQQPVQHVDIGDGVIDF